MPPGEWLRGELAMIPRSSVANVWRFDTEEAESNGDLLVCVQDRSRRHR
jgi:hypothetical protein